VPTYQYSCTDCGHFFETFQSFSDDSLTVCPECGGKLRKVFNAVGVVFKGSGFYRNDSRAGAGKNGSNGSGGSESGSGSSEKSAPAASTESGSGKSSGESKPAAKSEGSSGGSGAAAAKPA
jgi:putative FmdB family regulatory protein